LLERLIENSNQNRTEQNRAERKRGTQIIKSKVKKWRQWFS